MEPQAEKGSWSDLRTRALSSVAFAVVGLLCLWIGGVAFPSLIILAAIIMVQEWENLTQKHTKAVRLSGYAYIILPCACLLWMRSICVPSDPSLGFKIALALIAVISATDTGAYFAGKKFGNNKLAPAISPNKTWEGLIGGVVAATITGTLFSPYINIHQSVTLAISVSPMIAIVAQIGDLFKSWMKRRAGVKDSGNILPGHGGLLDRLDGYMFTAPILAIIIHFALKEIM